MSDAVLELACRPLPIEFDPAKTAVVVVDMQNGFASPGGSWSLAGVDVGPIHDVVPRIAAVLDAARSIGMRVVYLTMPMSPTPTPDGIPPQAFGGTGRERWRHYVDTNSTGRQMTMPAEESKSPSWNSDIVTAIAPLAGDSVIMKLTFGGFHGTDLETVLRSDGVDTLLFTGCTTSVCVETTLREAVVRGLRCVLVEDCVAEPIGGNLPRTNHDATVLVTELVLGWVASSSDVVNALRVLDPTASGHSGESPQL